MLRRALIAALLVGCSGAKQAPLNLADGCQPLLAGWDCFLPYPSDFYRAPDSTLPSGFRVETRGAAALKTRSGESADVSSVRPTDGFSRIPTVVFAFPADVSPAGFVKLADPPQSSLDAGSNTLLIDASTGQPVPHFVDLDPRATDPLRRAIVLHPIVPLREKARYVLFVHGVKQAGGAAVAAPEGFRRLRDRQADSTLTALASRYEADIFPILSNTGISRADLQLAWDFTTGSDAWAQADMLRVRDLTLQWLAANTPDVRVDQTEQNPDSDVWIRVSGSLSMPLFSTSIQPGAQLNRDAGGAVAQHGTARFPFVAQVSAAVRDQAGPGRTVGYGHGFFGSFGEVEGSARGVAQSLGAVLFAAEWWGMHLTDVGVVADGLLTHPAHTMDFADRVHQGMANWLVLTAAIRGPLRNLPQLQRASGEPVFAAGAPGYLGISQGAILGGTMAALNPDITRATLHLGGAGFTHMMMRARPFSAYLGFMNESLPDPLDQQKYIATLQRQFDRFEPATYASLLLAGDRRVLFQMGLGDSQVPNLGSFLDARALGLKVMNPSPIIPYGLTGQDAPFAGSALSIFDYGIDTAAFYASATPSDHETPVHEDLRTRPKALQQIQRFLDEGVIANTCGGVCSIP